MTASLGAPADPVLGLIEQACRKSSLVWLEYAGQQGPRPAWHVWHDGAVHVVHGGTEQQLPGLDKAGRVVVHTRSKDTGALLVRWGAAASTVPPSSPGWEPAAAALAAERLNARDAATLAEQWSAGSTITRLQPSEVLEQPGSYDTATRAAAPGPSPATTVTPRPKTLHRRQRRAPDL